MAIKTSLKDYFIIQGNKIKNEHFFSIINAGILYKDRKYVSTSKAPERTLFEYIVSGKGYIDNVDSGEMYTVSRGDCVVIRPFTKVKYYADPDDPYVKLWFTATGSFTDAMCDIFTCEPVTVVHNSHTAYKSFERLLKHIEKDKENGFKNAHGFLDIVHAIFSDSPQFSDNLQSMPHDILSERDTSDNGADLCERVVSYIDLFFCEGVTVADIAKHFDVSQRYLIEQFKRTHGTTPHKYINDKRMKFAALLLQNPRNTVNDVSESLGFCEPGYFTKAFANYYGVSPTQYRKSNGNG